jgi:hypothetical protein
MDTLGAILGAILSGIGWIISTIWNLGVWAANQLWDLILKPFGTFLIGSYSNVFNSHPVANILVVCGIIGVFKVMQFTRKRKKRPAPHRKPFVLTAAVAPILVSLLELMTSFVMDKEGGTKIDIDFGEKKTTIEGSIVNQGGGTVTGNSIGSGSSVQNNSNNSTTTDNSTHNSKSTKGPTNSLVIEKSSINNSSLNQSIEVGK